jgi:GNAT superfamily N-acetyltransferase
VSAVRTAQTDREILRCFPLMAQLRPHLKREEFVDRVRRQHRMAGYTLIYLEAEKRVRSLAGFRISECLYSGRYLYVDDLVTDSKTQGRGYGGKLFDWMVREAKRNQCHALTLDSGVQRFSAHRFYLQKRMDITCHHFSLKLAGPS